MIHISQTCPRLISHRLISHHYFMMFFNSLSIFLVEMLFRRAPSKKQQYFRQRGNYESTRKLLLVRAILDTGFTNEEEKVLQLQKLLADDAKVTNGDMDTRPSS